MPLPDATQVSGPVKELGKEDILEELNAPEENEEKEEPIKARGKEKEVEKEEPELEGEEQETEEEIEEIDELEELEKDLLESEDKDNELELVTPVPRAAILKKYPNLFKEFPYLEKAYYRERQFSEIFPTPSDAKVASEKATTLDKFEGQLLSGDLTEIIKAVKDEDGAAFGKLADNYLLTLSKVDETAYHHVVGNIIKSTIYNMVKEAQDLGDKEGAVIKNAAQILNQFVFGTSKWSGIQKFSKDSDNPERSDRERQLEEREENFRKQRFDTARTELDTKIDNRLKSIISQNLDPKETMTAYVKRNAERDVLEEVWKIIGKDSRFKVLKDKLWENAFKNDYDSAAMGRIETALISKAKTLLPSVIKKARIEALKGMGKRVKEENNEEQEIEQETVPKRRESTPIKGRQPVKKGEIPAHMSSRDFIMGND